MSRGSASEPFAVSPRGRMSAAYGQIACGGAAFRAVVRLLKSRHLRLLRHERIARTSQLIKVEQV